MAARPGRAARGEALDDAATPEAGAGVEPDLASEQRGRSLHLLGAGELVVRARRRKVARLTALSVVVLVATLLVVAGAQALIAARQMRLDALQQQLSSAVSRNVSLEVNRASLSAPDRILAVAEDRLKMIAPETVEFLTPVNPGPSVAEVAERQDATVPGGGIPEGSQAPVGPSHRRVPVADG